LVATDPLVLKGLVEMAVNKQAPWSVRESSVNSLTSHNLPKSSQAQYVKSIASIALEPGVNWKLRYAAVSALSGHPQSFALRALVSSLNDPRATPSIQKAAAEGLESAGAAGVEALTRNLRVSDEKWQVRYWSARALARQNNDFEIAKPYPQLSIVLTDTSPLVREVGASALGNVSTLISIFANNPGDERLRVRVANRLAQLGRGASLSASV